MDLLDTTNPDEYYITALQIFEYLGADSTGTLRVDVLMDKFAPFVKTNKSEYSCLRSHLDPNETNPEISVEELASALDKYSKSQKRKVDLDESFNLKVGRVPQDSDSGISTDGFQLLEELQCEIREKSRLTSQLRTQLELAERQHEESLNILSDERDSLQVRLSMVLEENKALVQVRQDYEEICEQLCNSETALKDCKRELDVHKRKVHSLQEVVSNLENDKFTLQELLNQSKHECHRINEMYASRQSSLLEQNEQLRSECADLTTRYQDQETLMHQIINERAHLEIELKDVVNKSNRNNLCFDRSIDVSFTEDQMLTAMNTLNAESPFVHDVASVSTQADATCLECAKRKVEQSTSKNWRRFIWEPLKYVYTILAGLCFVCALVVLYHVTRYSYPGRCNREPVPWSWLTLTDLLDLVFRIEYVGEVPM